MPAKFNYILPRGHGRKSHLGGRRTKAGTLTNIEPIRKDLKNFLNRVDMVLWDLNNSRFITAERDLLGPVQNSLEGLEDGSVLNQGEKAIARHKFDEAMGIYKQVLKQAQAAN